MIGHTLNTDTWFSQAEVAYSEVESLQWHDTSQFAPELVIHDDNLGMYFCLEAGAMRKATLPKYDPYMRAMLCIGLLPAKTALTPRKAQESAALMVNSFAGKGLRNPWTQRLFDTFTLQQADRVRRPVLRTFMVGKKTYLEHAGQMADLAGTRLPQEAVELLGTVLPNDFWMTEFTLVDLFSANKRKIGGILHSPEPESGDSTHGCLVIRFPDAIVIKGQPAAICPQPMMGHTPVLRLLLDVPEW